MLNCHDMLTLCQSGLAHLTAERLDDAEHDFQCVLELNPDHVQSLLALGVIAWWQQRYGPALGYACRVVALAPMIAAHHLLLARIQRDMGLLAEAAASFRAALGHTPSDNAARFELALVLGDAGLLEEAAACYRVVLQHNSDLAAAHYNLGNVLRRLGQGDDAIACYRAALAVEPEHDQAGNNLADALRHGGRLEEAEHVARGLVTRHPDMVEAHYTLGTILFAENRLTEAVAAFETVLRLRPDHPDAPNKLGATLLELGELDAATTYLRQAVQRQPTRAAPHSNLGVALRELGQVDAAEACFVRALALDKTFAPARYNLATTLLQTGRLGEGWDLFESRWNNAIPSRPFVQPRWDGQPVGDMTLLLHAEQGLGDTLQFCRYVPAAAQLGRVVLEVQPALARLMRQSLPGVDTIISRGDTLPRFDRHCPLMSLPLLFGTTLQTIPSKTPYLVADPVDLDKWRRRLGALPGLRVGLVWRGNPQFASSTQKRDMDPAHLAHLSDIPGVSFVSLQKHLSPQDRFKAASCLALTDWTDALNDFADTAALVAGLDLVIGVDTAVVHLAGGLGRPTWLLNRFDPCWRWLRDRDDSPWYPGLRQFRQGTPRDWPGVMAAVRTALIAHRAERRSPEATTSTTKTKPSSPTIYRPASTCG